MLLPRPLVLVLKTGIMNKTRGSRFPIHSKEGSKFYSWKSNWKCMNYFTEIKCILRNKLRTPCCCCLGLIEIKLPGYFHEAVSSWSDSFLLSLIVTFFWMIDANKSESLQQWSCSFIPRFSIFSFHVPSWILKLVSLEECHSPGFLDICNTNFKLKDTTCHFKNYFLIF